jgi:hypothetical protein
VKLEKPIKTGRRITTYEGEPDVASITWAAMSSQKGKMVISGGYSLEFFVSGLADKLT